MLVLSRKVNEKIRIGDNIEITVVSITGDQVRLGIEASKEIKILRSEVYAEIQRQNTEAVVASPEAETEIPAQLQQLIKGRLAENKK